MRTQELLDETLPSRPGSSIGPRPRRLTLRANFVWTFAGNVVYSGCQWGVLVVLARMGDPDMVGLFALGLAVTAPVFMFGNLQLRGVQATDARREYLFGDYLGARLLTSALALLGIGGLVFLSDYKGEMAAVILAVAAAKACESIGDIVYGLLQQHERMDRIAVSVMLRGAIGLTAVSAGVWLTHQLLWGVLGMVAAWFGVLAVYDSRSILLVGERREDGWSLVCPRWRTATLGRLFWLAVPLGIVTCLISLNSNIPRYFIEHYLDLRALGVFSAVGYLMVVGNTVVCALGQSASPRLAAHYVAGERAKFRFLLGALTGIGGLLGVGGVLAAYVAGPAILGLIYGPDYADRTDLFVLLMYAAGVEYATSILGYGVTAARYFRVQVPVFVIVCSVVVIGSALLVPEYGLQGAAWAVLLATLCQMVLLASVVVFIDTRMPKRGG